MNNPTPHQQRELLLDVLRHGPATTEDLRALGIPMPAKRVWDLRQDGTPIVTRKRPNGFALYELADPL